MDGTDRPAGSFDGVEYPAVPFIRAGFSALMFVVQCERSTGDSFGVAESLEQPLADIWELLRRMEAGEL